MSTAALLLDYLFCRELIKARLSSQVAMLADEGSVVGIEQFTQAVDRTISAPTAFVLWEGDTFDTGPNGQALHGAAQIVVQSWTVLLAVRNADQFNADARHESAGPLLSDIHKALAGWVPSGLTRSMRRLQGRRPSYQPNRALYPLTFGISLHL